MHSVCTYTRIFRLTWAPNEGSVDNRRSRACASHTGYYYFLLLALFAFRQEEPNRDPKLFPCI